MSPIQQNLLEIAFARYRGGLQRYLMRRLDRAQDAQDLAQEVYLRLLRVDEKDLVRQPQAYMYRIASHVIYEFKLREEREKQFVTIDSEVLAELAERIDEAAVDEPLQKVNTERELERVLAQLPPLERAIVLMDRRDGLNYAQIGEKLELSAHTVKKYLFRALLLLRQSGWDR